MPFWNERIAPQLASGKNVLVAAHGNSLRALVKMLDKVSERDIVELNIPTGVPLLYELDVKLRPLTASTSVISERSRRQPMPSKPRRPNAAEPHLLG